MPRHKKHADNPGDSSSSGSIMDDTDREVSCLTDRAFRSLCLAEEEALSELQQKGSPVKTLQSTISKQVSLNHTTNRSNFLNRLSLRASERTKWTTTFHQAPKSINEERKGFRKTSTKPSIVEFSVPDLRKHSQKSKVSSLIKTFDNIENEYPIVLTPETQRSSAKHAQKGKGQSRFDQETVHNNHSEVSEFSDACHENYWLNEKYDAQKRKISKNRGHSGHDGFSETELPLSQHPGSTTHSPAKKNVKHQKDVRREPANKSSFLHSEHSAFKSWSDHHKKHFVPLDCVEWLTEQALIQGCEVLHPLQSLHTSVCDELHLKSAIEGEPTSHAPSTHRPRETAKLQDNGARTEVISPSSSSSISSSTAMVKKHRKKLPIEIPASTSSHKTMAKSSQQDSPAESPLPLMSSKFQPLVKNQVKERLVPSPSALPLPTTTSNRETIESQKKELPLNSSVDSRTTEAVQEKESLGDSPPLLPPIRRNKVNRQEATVECSAFLSVRSNIIPSNQDKGNHLGSSSPFNLLITTNIAGQNQICHTEAVVGPQNKRDMVRHPETDSKSSSSAFSAIISATTAKSQENEGVSSLPLLAPIRSCPMGTDEEKDKVQTRQALIPKQGHDLLAEADALPSTMQMSKGAITHQAVVQEVGVPSAPDDKLVLTVNPKDIPKETRSPLLLSDINKTEDKNQALDNPQKVASMSPMPLEPRKSTDDTPLLDVTLPTFRTALDNKAHSVTADSAPLPCVSQIPTCAVNIQTSDQKHEPAIAFTPWRRGKVKQRIQQENSKDSAKTKDNVHLHRRPTSAAAHFAETKQEYPASDTSPSFNITRLLTPIIPRKSITEALEDDVELVTPPPGDISAPRDHEQRTVGDGISRENYRARASSLLFNIKDVRKRVKSTYSNSPLLKQADEQLRDHGRIERERVDNGKIDQGKVEKRKKEIENVSKMREKEILEKEAMVKERLARETLERANMVREKLEQEKLEKEKLEKERLEKEKLEREQRENQEKENMLKLEREKLEKEKIERREREKLERLEREEIEREKWDKLERERIEKKKKEKQEREKIIREKFEKENMEKQEREKIMREKIRMQKIERENEEKEKTEREKNEREKIEREKNEREKIEKDKQGREKAEREKIVKQKNERETIETEKNEIEKTEKEKIKREKNERENIERENNDREKIEQEKNMREKTEREMIEREKNERREIEREMNERERTEREKIEREKNEREKLQREHQKKKLEKLELEKIEREQIEEAERTKTEREKDKIQKENLEKDTMKREVLEKEHLENLEKENYENLKTEKTEKEKAEGKKVPSIEGKKLEKEQFEIEKPEKKQSERCKKERVEMEKSEKEHTERKKTENDKTERDKFEKDWIEREKIKTDELERENCQRERLQKEAMNKIENKETANYQEEKGKINKAMTQKTNDDNERLLGQGLEKEMEKNKREQLEEGNIEQKDMERNKGEQSEMDKIKNCKMEQENTAEAEREMIDNIENENFVKQERKINEVEREEDTEKQSLKIVEKEIHETQKMKIEKDWKKEMKLENGEAENEGGEAKIENEKPEIMKMDNESFNALHIDLEEEQSKACIKKENPTQQHLVHNWRTFQMENKAEVNGRVADNYLTLSSPETIQDNVCTLGEEQAKKSKSKDLDCVIGAQKPTTSVFQLRPLSTLSATTESVTTDEQIPVGHSRERGEDGRAESLKLLSSSVEEQASEEQMTISKAKQNEKKKDIEVMLERSVATKDVSKEELQYYSLSTSSPESEENTEETQGECKLVWKGRQMKQHEDGKVISGLSPERQATNGTSSGETKRCTSASFKPSLFSIKDNRCKSSLVTRAVKLPLPRSLSEDCLLSCQWDGGLHSRDVIGKDRLSFGGEKAQDRDTKQKPLNTKSNGHGFLSGFRRIMKQFSQPNGTPISPLKISDRCYSLPKLHDDNADIGRLLSKTRRSKEFEVRPKLRDTASFIHARSISIDSCTSPEDGMFYSVPSSESDYRMEPSTDDSLLNRRDESAFNAAINNEIMTSPIVSSYFEDCLNSPASAVSEDLSHFVDSAEYLEDMVCSTATSPISDSIACSFVASPTSENTTSSGFTTAMSTSEGFPSPTATEEPLKHSPESIVASNPVVSVTHNVMNMANSEAYKEGKEKLNQFDSTDKMSLTSSEAYKEVKEKQNQFDNTDKMTAKPPTVPPKTEKALRRAKRLASKRQKSEAQQLKKTYADGTEPVLTVPSPMTVSPSPLALTSSMPPLAHHTLDFKPVDPRVIRHTGAASLTPASSMPLTQRKLLQDPDSGQYFVVDVPMQVQLKTFYDPDTDKYIQVSVPSSEVNHMQSSSMENLNNPYMLYPEYLPLSVTSVPPRSSSQLSAPAAFMQEQLKTEKREAWNRDLANRDFAEKHPYIEPVCDSYSSSPYSLDTDSYDSRRHDIISIGDLDEFAVEGIS